MREEPLVAYDVSRGGNPRWRGGMVRNARRLPVKAEPSDDQRALKEDWVASALLVLRDVRVSYVCICMIRRN